MKLVLSKETLAELTADDMQAVVGGADSESCSCTIASCITRTSLVVLGIPVVDVNVCDVLN